MLQLCYKLLLVLHYNTCYMLLEITIIMFWKITIATLSIFVLRRCSVSSVVDVQFWRKSLVDEFTWNKGCQQFNAVTISNNSTQICRCEIKSPLNPKELRKGSFYNSIFRQFMCYYGDVGTSSGRFDFVLIAFRRANSTSKLLLSVPIFQKTCKEPCEGEWNIALKRWCRETLRGFLSSSPKLLILLVSNDNSCRTSLVVFFE